MANTMKKKKSDTLHYQNPPVIEVVCGVTFKSLMNMMVPHFGQLWDLYRSEYPLCRDLAPLPFEIDPSVSELHFNIEGVTDVPPLPRIWFFDAQENKIIQLQRNRFLHNWKKMLETDEYPRHQQIITDFKERLSTFERFVSEAKLGTVEITHCELTYVNHIPKGQGWDSIDEAGKVFPMLSLDRQAKEPLINPLAFHLQTVYSLPNNSGKLHATMRSAVTVADKSPLFALEITAKGKRESNIGEWFDTAHTAIIEAFQSLTCEKIQNSFWR